MQACICVLEYACLYGCMNVCMPIVHSIPQSQQQRSHEAQAVLTPWNKRLKRSVKNALGDQMLKRDVCA